MTEIVKDGGAAFPSETFASEHRSGMTLRDYFAAKAMAARIETLGEHYHSSDSERIACKAETAQRAYEMADAMLAVRSKSGADQ